MRLSRRAGDLVHAAGDALTAIALGTASSGAPPAASAGPALRSRPLDIAITLTILPTTWESWQTVHGSRPEHDVHHHH